MIRIAKIEDLAEIVSIYNQSIPGRQSTADTEIIHPESRIYWFHEHNDKRPLWVMQKDQEIAGWLSLQSFYGRAAYAETVEVSVYIKTQFHRQGIAKKLMLHALDVSPAFNITTLLGFIFGHNQPSINLFSSFGFKQWGFLPQVASLDGNKTDLTIYGLRI